MALVRVRYNGDDGGPVFDVKGHTLPALLDAVSARISAPARKLFADTEAGRGLLVVDFKALPAGQALFAVLGRDEHGRDTWGAFAGHEALRPGQAVVMAATVEAAAAGGAGATAVFDFQRLARGQPLCVSRGEAYIDLVAVKQRRDAALAGMAGVKAPPPKLPPKLPAGTPAAAVAARRPASAK